VVDRPPWSCSLGMSRWWLRLERLRSEVAGCRCCSKALLARHRGAAPLNVMLPWRNSACNTRRFSESEEEMGGGGGAGVTVSEQ